MRDAREWFPVRLSKTGGFAALPYMPRFGAIARCKTNRDKISECKSVFCFYALQLNMGPQELFLVLRYFPLPKLLKQQ